MSSEGASGEADAREDVEAEATADASKNCVESESTIPADCDPPSTSTIPAADAAECSICFDEPPSAPCKTKCGHVFCRDCFLQTLKSQRPWNRGKCPLCRALVTVYNTLDLASDAPLDVPDVDTIFGSVYLQGGSVGQASYHFDAPDDVYISYENAPARWTLDDGSPPPKQKQFVDPHYDEATRTFTGTIHWSDSPFNGDSRWDYTMVFSDDFSLICSGSLRTFSVSGEEGKGESFPETLRYWRRRTPPTGILGCAFMQAGIPQTLTSTP